MSTNLILDLQDIAWYMGQVIFRTPQVKSFFSQYAHFEYRQMSVQLDVQQEEEALVTGDNWRVDCLWRELIRHHKDKGQYLHETQRPASVPIPKEQLRHERVTRIEYQKSGKKVLHKENWRAEKMTSLVVSGRARQSTRSRMTMRFLKMSSEVTLIIKPRCSEETLMI